jgi:hypothetical protein
MSTREKLLTVRDVVFFFALVVLGLAIVSQP